MSLKSSPLSSGPPDSSEFAGSNLLSPPCPLETFNGAWDLMVTSDTSSVTAEGVDNHMNNWTDLGHGPTLADTDVNTPVNTPCVSMEPEENDCNADTKKNLVPIPNNSQVLFEFDLPVVSNSFEEQWAEQVEEKVMTFTEDPYMCFNPLDVEGKQFPTPEPQPKAKKVRPILPKLIMPNAKPVSQQQQDGLNTPAVESVLKKNVDQSGFDLLEFVTNKELPVNDPTFLSMLELENNTPSPASTLDLTEISRTTKPAKRKRNTPTKPSSQRSRGRVSRPTATVTSSSRSDDHLYDSSSTVTSCDEINDVRYRRMRDLNNLASKRCRANRKRKFETLLSEEDQLRTRNGELRMRCQHLEDLVGKLKKEFINKVTNPRKKMALDHNTLDLDQLLAIKLESF